MTTQTSAPLNAAAEAFCRLGRLFPAPTSVCVPRTGLSFGEIPLTAGHLAALGVIADRPPEDRVDLALGLGAALDTEISLPQVQALLWLGARPADLTEIADRHFIAEVARDGRIWAHGLRAADGIYVAAGGRWAQPDAPTASAPTLRGAIARFEEAAPAAPSEHPLWS